MDTALVSKSFPPGIRFHPTDEELFMYYLKRKVLGKSLRHQIMSEIDVYQFAPWELPAKSCLKTRDLNWYFMCPRSRKYPSGGRTNRGTVHGFWKSSGNDRTVNYRNRPVGKIKTLIFYRGKTPKGERTNWVIHEYRLEDKVLSEKGVALDSYVICKIFMKSGLGPKNGENYGAPFVEEEWDNSNDENVASAQQQQQQQQQQQSVSVDIAGCSNGSTITSTLASPSTLSTVQPYVATTKGLPPIETEEDELDRLLAKFTEECHNKPTPQSNVVDGLGNLAGRSSATSANFDWSKFDWYDLCD